MTGPELEVRALSPAGGIEVLNADLRLAGDPRLAAQLDALLARHGALLFRDQDLVESAQSIACGAFGTLTQRGPPGRRSYTAYVSNVAGTPDSGGISGGLMDLHFDGCFNAEHYKATVLYCIEADADAGRTLLVDCARAWDELDDTFANAIDRYSAVHVYRNGDRQRPEAPDPDARSAVHPLVIGHPESGRAVLYVCRLMTMRVNGLNVQESERLLEKLFAHIERPDRVYAHQWRQGDFLIFDNRRMAHGRSDYEPSSRRVLRRQVLSGVPLEPARAGASRQS